MSKQTDTENEKIVRELFQRVKETPVEVSPYLKTRILAHVGGDRKHLRALRFWQLLSGTSLAALLVVGFFSYQMLQKKSDEAVTQQAYVIQIDFNQNDREMVAKAEVELPSEVHFVTSNKNIQNEKKLKLPVSEKTLGRGKLPFVVASESSGEKSIRVRLLNAQDEVIREQVFKVSFAKQGNSVNF